MPHRTSTSRIFSDDYVRQPSNATADRSLPKTSTDTSPSPKYETTIYTNDESLSISEPLRTSRYVHPVAPHLSIYTPDQLSHFLSFGYRAYFKTSSACSFLLLNARSLKNKLGFLSSFAALHSPSIMLVTET